MVKKSSDAGQVQGTNDSATISKLSFVQRSEIAGFFGPSSQRFLRPFVSKVHKRSPLLNVGYYVRSRAIDLSVQSFLERHASAQNISIVNTGAGFDALPFRLAAAREGAQKLLFIDVDYPALLDRKLAVIRQSDELKAVFPHERLATPSSATFESGNAAYTLLKCDMADSGAVSRALRDVLGQEPILFISEVALVYMPPSLSAPILSLAASFANSELLILEQTLPAHPATTTWAETMLSHFATAVGTPLRGLDSWPTMKSQGARFRDAGWAHSDVRSLAAVWDALPDELREKQTRLQPFDEWEELDLYLAHYYIALASHSSATLPFTKCARSTTTALVAPCLVSECITLPESFTMERRGHAMAPLGDDAFLLFGGWGSTHKAEPHSRLGHTATWSLAEGLQVLDVSLEPPRRMYSTAASVDSIVYLFGGRGAPHQVLGDLWAFCRQQGWRQLACTGPPARFRHACSRLPGERGFLVHGGISASGDVLSDCWLFSKDDETWTDISATLSPILGARHSHALAIDKMADDDTLSTLVCLGGLSSRSAREATPSVIVKLGEHAAVQGVQALLGPGRYGAKLATVRHAGKVLIAVCGGISDSHGAKLEDAVVATDLGEPGKWASLGMAGGRVWVDHQVCTTADGGSLIVTGGGVTCFGFGSVFETSSLALRLPLQ